MSDPKLPPPDDGAPSGAPTVFDDGKTTRREFVGTAVVGGALLSTGLLTVPGTVEAASPKPANVEGTPVAPVAIKLNVNGKEHALQVEPRVTLLDALRERLALTGTKKGCDQGQCGACTVLVDGRRVLSCLTLAATCEGREATTVEGLAKGEELHPLQAAFIKYDGFQCGYCTPGQLCSAVGMLAEAKRGDVSHVTEDVNASKTRLTDDEIRERMSGNICRCGAYPKIVAALQEAHSGRESARTWRYVEEEELARVRKEAADEAV